MGDIDPVAHYEANRDVYDHIQNRIEATSDFFASAPRPVQKVLLNKAVTWSLISVETAVELHEHGYLNVLQVPKLTVNAVQDALLDAGVNYYRNKASYILHNLTEPDYDMVLDHYDDYCNGNASAIHRMHRAIRDEFKGVGLRKAGFAMANAVTPQKMCVDRHVANLAGLDADEIYTGVVVDRYEQQCQDIMAQWPELADDLPPYLFQWVLFDADMDTVTTHDAWFMSLPDEAQVV